MTSFECLTSANYFVKFVQSAFSESDTSASAVNISHSELMTSDLSENNALQGIDEMIQGLKNNEKKEWNERIDSVAFMTYTFYKKKDVNPTDSGVKLGNAADATTARTLLITRRFETFMDKFMGEIKEIQTFYDNNKIKVNENNVNQNEFSQLVWQYFRAREDIIKKTFVFSAIRDAFMHGSGINMCNGSAKLDEKLLVSK